MSKFKVGDIVIFKPAPNVMILQKEIREGDRGKVVFVDYEPNSDKIQCKVVLQTGYKITVCEDYLVGIVKNRFFISDLIDGNILNIIKNEIHTLLPLAIDYPDNTCKVIETVQEFELFLCSRK